MAGTTQPLWGSHSRRGASSAGDCRIPLLPLHPPSSATGERQLLIACPPPAVTMKSPPHAPSVSRRRARHIRPEDPGWTARLRHPTRGSSRTERTMETRQSGGRGSHRGVPPTRAAAIADESPCSHGYSTGGLLPSSLPSPPPPPPHVAAVVTAPQSASQAPARRCGRHAVGATARLRHAHRSITSLPPLLPPPPLLPSCCRAHHACDRQVQRGGDE